MVTGSTLLTFAISTLTLVSNSAKGAVLCGCGPHKFMQKSQDFLVYQLSGQRVRFQAETVLSSDNVSWGIFQGESGLNNGEIANLYRSGTFQRVGKEFKVELLNVTFGGILSKWIFGKRSDNENVYAKIGIGDIPGIRRLKLRCRNEISICADARGAPAPVVSIYKRNFSASIMRREPNSTWYCSTVDPKSASTNVTFLFVASNCFGRNSLQINFATKNLGNSKSCMWKFVSSPKTATNTSTIECSTRHFDATLKHSIPDMSASFVAKPTGLATKKLSRSRQDVDNHRSHYTSAAAQLPSTQPPQTMSFTVSGTYPGAASGLASTVITPSNVIPTIQGTAVPSESTRTDSEATNFQGGKEWLTSDSTEDFVTTEISLTDTSDYTGMPSFAVITAAVGAATMLALGVVLIAACLRKRQRVRSSKTKPIQDHGDTMKWLHSRFCTESPDQSIHYEQLAIERTDQRESSSTTTYDHPVRSNGFLEPEQDYGAIKTPPLLPQDEEQDHSSISGQGFFKEDHRMISERQNEEISVYSTARNAKVHRLNGSIRQAEEHNSQLQTAEIHRPDSEAGAGATRDMSQKSRKHVVVAEINIQQCSTNN